MTTNYTEPNSLKSAGLLVEQANFVAALYLFFENAEVFFMNSRNGSLTEQQRAGRDNFVTVFHGMMHKAQIARMRVFGVQYEQWRMQTDGEIIAAGIAAKDWLRAIVLKYQRESRKR